MSQDEPRFCIRSKLKNHGYKTPWYLDFDPLPLVWVLVPRQSEIANWHLVLNVLFISVLSFFSREGFTLSASKRMCFVSLINLKLKKRDKRLKSDSH